MTRPSDPNAIVVVDQVRAGYDGADVIGGVSLDFRRGEVLGFLGPNGAGKSTLIRVLTGALAPRGGQVRFLGTGAVGLVPQEIALYPWLSPKENVIAFGRLAGLSRAETFARAGPVIELSGCLPVERIPVSRLSGGYQRRANVAAALMSQPDLLILDEPTAGLDAEGRRHVGAVVAALREAGAAIMLVTHDFEFAESLADRIAILDRGLLACCGVPRDLIAARLADADRVEIVLAEAPDEETRKRLVALGALATSERRMWRLWRGAPGFDTTAVAAELEAARLAVAELRVRRPGLEDLYAAATGKDLAA